MSERARAMEVVLRALAFHVEARRHPCPVCWFFQGDAAPGKLHADDCELVAALAMVDDAPRSEGGSTMPGAMKPEFVHAREVAVAREACTVTIQPDGTIVCTCVPAKEAR